MKLNLYNRFLKFMGHKVPVWVILVIMNFYWLTTSVYDIIIQNQSLRKRMGQIDATRKDIHDSLKAPYKKAKKEYYDSYNKVTHLEYSTGEERIVVPIQPSSVPLDSKEKFISTSSNKIRESPLKVVLEYLKIIDAGTSDSTRKYGYAMKVLLDSSDKTVALILNNGLCIPLIREKYNVKTKRLKFRQKISTPLS